MATDKHSDHIQTSGELFRAVQKSRVFSDSKQFVDMIPTDDPKQILAKWKEQKDSPGFGLKSFVTQYFKLPEVAGETIEIGSKESCREHIQELWPMLFRPADDASQRFTSLIPLPYPYVVPGGRFREIYYWDSYFTARGLITDGHKEMVLNMARNFRHMIETCGHIPNGNRVYYLSRSQPPFFIPMIALLAEQFGDDIITEFYDAAVLEYRFWKDQTGVPNRRLVTISDQNENTHVLNRYWDDNPSPREESWIEDVKEFEQSGLEDKASFYRNIRAACESGWDFSSRWLSDEQSLSKIETTNILPVDLNTLLWFAESRLADWSSQQGLSSNVDIFKTSADQRKASIDSLMWNPDRDFYFDYHINQKKPTNCLSLAAVYPLYFKMAGQDQAASVAKTLEQRFLKEGGLLTTTIETGQQWDAPNGWAPLQWMAVAGLKNYGFETLADDIRSGWLDLNERIYRESGKMVEKYNVSDTHKKGGGGEYTLQDGFGWTNGVFSALSDM